MALTFSQLTTPRTKEELRLKLLAALQGIGFTSHTGFSPGTVTLTGTPNGEYDIRLKIIASGILGVGTFQYSTDGGTVYSSTQTIPANGVYSIPGTDLSTLFANGPTGSGSSFLAGDIFSITTTVTAFPVTSWQTGSVPLTLLENNATAMEDFSALIQQIGKGGLLLEAEGDWLDLWAENVYDFQRSLGLTTQGYVRLYDTGGAGPHSITNNQLWALSASGLRYNSVGTYTLTASGSVDVLFQAESPGSIYNVANTTITQLVTSLPGVTLSNIIYSGGTWITRYGTDDETDRALRLRCQERWPDIGTGATAQVYDLWAKTASTTVTRTKIQASGTVAGQVEVYLAGSAGAVAGAVVTAVDTYIQPRIPLTCTALVQSATGVATTVTSNVYVASAYAAQAAIDCSTNLQALFNGGTTTAGEVLTGIDIGSTVYLAQIIEMLQIVTGVRNVTVSLPAADVVLTATQVATLTQNLSFISV